MCNLEVVVFHGNGGITHHMFHDESEAAVYEAEMLDVGKTTSVVSLSDLDMLQREMKQDLREAYPGLKPHVDDIPF